MLTAWKGIVDVLRQRFWQGFAAGYFVGAFFVLILVWTTHP